MNPSRSARKHGHFFFLSRFYLAICIAQYSGTIHDARKAVRDYIEYCAYTGQQKDGCNSELYDMGNCRDVSSVLHGRISFWNCDRSDNDIGEKTGRKFRPVFC